MTRIALASQTPWKRFLVFAHEEYYPSGGIYDVQDHFDSLEEAEAFAERLSTVPEKGMGYITWLEVSIFDCEKRVIVWEWYAND